MIHNAQNKGSLHHLLTVFEDDDGKEYVLSLKRNRFVPGPVRTLDMGWSVMDGARVVARRDTITEAVEAVMEYARQRQWRNKHEAPR
jgi:hypothetical protein